MEVLDISGFGAGGIRGEVINVKYKGRVKKGFLPINNAAEILHTALGSTDTKPNGYSTPQTPNGVISEHEGN